MKLSIETLSICNKFGDIKAFQLIKQAGYDAIDMTYTKPTADNFEDDLRWGENYVEYAKTLRAELDRLNLECVQAHAPIVIKYEDELNENNQNYKKVVRCIHSASILGAKYIVVHAVGVPDGVDLLEYNLKLYNSFIPYLEKYGIKMGVENLCVYLGVGKWGSRFGRPEELSELVNLLDEKYFVACIDLGHAALNYGTAEDFIRDMNVGDRIKMLHVQESDFVRDSHNFPYSGGYKWDEILKNLKEKGYKGDFSFEIFKVFEFLPNELVLDALIFTEKIGRFLIDKFSNL